MRRAIQLVIVLALGMVVSACGSLPGLRVLTGQDSPNTQADTIVQSADFVMADKTGLTDPALLAAADRIEAASGTVDIIEIRSVPDERAFIVDMLFNPPQTDTSTQAGQVAQLDSLRRAIELTWQGTMNVSTDADLLQVTLYAPQTVQTLDNGTSFVGIIVAQAGIERAAAVDYLAGERSLERFFDLIAQGTLVYTSPQSVELYQSVPNHPMYMLPQ
jgi:hypothetical protein